MSPSKARIISLDEFSGGGLQEPIWVGAVNMIAKDDLEKELNDISDLPAGPPIPDLQGSAGDNICMAIWLEKFGDSVNPIVVAPIDLADFKGHPLAGSLQLALAEAKNAGVPPPKTIIVKTPEEAAALRATKLPPGCKVVVEPDNSDVSNFCASLLQDIMHATKDRIETVAPVPGVNGVTEDIKRNYFSMVENFARAQAWKLGKRADSFLIVMPGDDYCLGLIVNEDQEDPGFVLIPIPKPEKDSSPLAFFEGTRPYNCLRMVKHPICSEEVIEYIADNANYFIKSKYTPYAESLDTQNNVLEPNAKDFDRLILTAAALISVKAAVSAKKIPQIKHESSVDLTLEEFGGAKISICFYDRAQDQI